MSISIFIARVPQNLNLRKCIFEIHQILSFLSPTPIFKMDFEASILSYINSRFKYSNLLKEGSLFVLQDVIADHDVITKNGVIKAGEKIEQVSIEFSMNSTYETLDGDELGSIKIEF